MISLWDEAVRYAPAAITGGIYFAVKTQLSKIDHLVKKVGNHGERLAVIEDRCGVTATRTRGCEEGAD